MEFGSKALIAGALALAAGFAVPEAAAGGGPSYGYGYGYGHTSHGRGHVAVRGGHHRGGHHRGGHGRGAAHFGYGIGAGLLLSHIIYSSRDRDRVQIVQPAPVYAPPPAGVATAPAAPATDCIQTREYQSLVTVGGREVEGYGTACLKADGSWELGPPQVEPVF